MKNKKTAVIASVLILSLLVGCESKAATGVLAGGALGAGIGGIAGGGQGALIGGAAGVIAGGLIGASLDESDQRNLKNQSAQTYRHVDRGEKLTVDDIINMKRARISDQKIIDLIRKTQSSYTLNKYQINRLKSSGVSQEVIDYMMYTPKFVGKKQERRVHLDLFFCEMQNERSGIPLFF